MPKSKQKSRPRDDDSDVEVSQTQGQGNMTQAKKAIAALSDDETARKVSDLVQYLLIMDQKKFPIKRQDINKMVLKDHSKAFVIFIEKAKQQLLEVFGIQLVELDTKNKSYILVNTLETDVDDPHLEWPPEDNAKMGLIVVVLSIIFMSGNTIQDSKLYHTLKKLGLDVDVPRNHEVFGDVKRFLSQELVRQGYLEYTRQDLSDPPAYDYCWGPRAKHETSKRNILDFVCQVYQMNPSIWTSQWQDVIRSEGALETENGGATSDSS